MARVKSLLKNKNAVTLMLLAAFYAVVSWMLYSGHITRQWQHHANFNRGFILWIFVLFITY